MAVALLTPGPAFAGARMLRAGGAWAAAGFAACMWALVLPVWVLREGRVSQGLAVYKLDPAARHGWKRLWLGPGEWLSVPDKGRRVERWGVSMRSALPWKHWVLALDILLTQLSSILAGAGGGGCRACAALRAGND
eukprot:gene27384-5283_t